MSINNSLIQDLFLCTIFGNPIPLQDYIGTGTPHNCDKNSWVHRRSLLVFKGELIPRYRPFYDGTTLAHIFNVDPITNRVIEYSPLNVQDSHDWYSNYFYFGKLSTATTLKTIWDDNNSETLF